MQKRLAFLGFIISTEGIEPNPKKMHAIAEYPIPKKKKEVRAYLGLLNFHSQYMPNFTLRARPLQKLTGKNAKFQWNQEEQTAFEELKELMLKPPIMKFPNFNVQFQITTDASDVSIAAVLQQEQEGTMSLIDSIGRALTSTEKNYSVTERELLAIVYSLKKWRCYLLNSNHETIIMTDHLPLCHLNKLNNLQGRLQRWLWDMSEVTHTIKYVPGKTNKLADSLSRREYLRSMLTELPKSFNNMTIQMQYTKTI